MANQITVKLEKNSYPIVVGRKLLHSVGEQCKRLGLGAKILIITNKKVAKLFLKIVQSSLVRAGFQVSVYLLPFGDERDKSEGTLLKIWQTMAKIPLERTSSVLALGGGVVGDVSAFAASTYMRGISVIQVPTTLLAQVDSAIGGKTAIDLPMAKNVVGTFHQPKLVICDISTLETLPADEYRHAFAEVIKYGVIQDRELFKLLEGELHQFFFSLTHGGLSDQELRFLETVVWRCAKIKAQVVEEDERETSGKRMILNYGHTFAHALEAASNYTLSHGQAVALGMILAAEMGMRMNLCDERDEIRQMALIRKAGLPVRLSDLKKKTSRLKNIGQLLNFMKRDKKVRGGKLKFVLLATIGQVQVVELAEKPVEKLLRDFLKQG